jgi:hypothetical protein
MWGYHIISKRLEPITHWRGVVCPKDRAVNDIAPEIPELGGFIYPNTWRHDLEARDVPRRLTKFKSAVKTELFLQP